MALEGAVHAELPLPKGWRVCYIGKAKMFDVKYKAQQISYKATTPVVPHSFARRLTSPWHELQCCVHLHVNGCKWFFVDVVGGTEGGVHIELPLPFY